jgi:hypothetical protein
VKSKLTKLDLPRKRSVLSQTITIVTGKAAPRSKIAEETAVAQGVINFVFSGLPNISKYY